MGEGASQATSSELLAERPEVQEEVRDVVAELARARERYVGLCDLAPVGFVTLDEVGLVCTANATAARLLGVPRERLIGRPFADCFGLAQGRMVDLHLHSILSEPRTTETDYEATCVHPNGRSRILRVKNRVCRQDDGDVECWVALTDVTAERKNEHALLLERNFADRLLDIAPVIALVLDRRGRIVRFNRYMEDLSGYSLAEVRGASWFETFLPARHRDPTRRLFEEALSGDQTVANVNPIVVKCGEERIIEWYDTPIEDEGGMLTGVLAIGRDITDARRFEAEARQAQKMEAVGTLAAGVAHDFNNLLMGIVGVVEMSLAQLGTDHDVAQLLETVRDRGKTGAAVVKQLMAFSRRASPEPATVSVDSAITRIAGMLRMMLGEDVTLNLSLASGGLVCMGEGQLEQVVTNLVVNARQAMPEGGAVEIRTSRLRFQRDHFEVRAGTAPGDYVRIEVEDSGCGMDEETRTRVFEPFFTTKEVGEGTGLGLSTAYGIVKGWDGYIEVESSPGLGSTFRIDIPRVRDSQLDLRIPLVRVAGGQGQTVLLVDDEELIRMTVRHYLTEGGYRVLEAGSADEAAALCREHAPEVDLLVSDIVLPGRQGAELARELAELAPGLRTVFMSAYPADVLLRQNRIPLGTSVLEKPFEAEELMCAVRSALTDPD